MSPWRHGQERSDAELMRGAPPKGRQKEQPPCRLGDMARNEVTPSLCEGAARRAAKGATAVSPWRHGQERSDAELMRGAPPAGRQKEQPPCRPGDMARNEVTPSLCEGRRPQGGRGATAVSPWRHGQERSDAELMRGAPPAGRQKAATAVSPWRHGQERSDAELMRGAPPAGRQKEQPPCRPGDMARNEVTPQPAPWPGTK